MSDCTIAVQGSARAASTEFTPRRSNIAFPTCSAPAMTVSGVDVGASAEVPLWHAALWNRPAASGEFINDETLPQPPDCPKIVTLSGSPPKLRMLFFTHVSA